VDEETKKEEKAVVISEIGRARNLVGEAFVVKMKEKLKQEALQRMEAEKKVYSVRPRRFSSAYLHTLRARTPLSMTNVPLVDVSLPLLVKSSHSSL
jgi:protein-arginine kinase